MADLILPLCLAAVALVYVSVLLFIRFGTAGVPRDRVWLAVAEVWLTFAVVIGLLAILRHTLGDVKTGSVGDEFSARWAQFVALPLLGRCVIVATLLAVVGLFAHLMWSLRATERMSADIQAGDGSDGASPSLEETEEEHESSRGSGPGVH